MSVLQVSDLSIGYDNRPIADNISFTVEEGQYVCIIGENGAGKSTLLKCLLKLNKPMSGEISYTTTGGIGYLPQQSDIQKDFPATVWEIALSGNILRAGHSPIYSKKDKQRTMENLERMRISDLRRKSFRNLSGGQQQRVLLARALCASSELLILDEPVSGLDSNSTSELYQLLRDLNKEGMTIIMVTHDTSAVRDYASNVLMIENKKAFYYSAEAFWNSHDIDGKGSIVER